MNDPELSIEERIHAVSPDVGNGVVVTTDSVAHTHSVEHLEARRVWSQDPRTTRSRRPT